MDTQLTRRDATHAAFLAALLLLLGGPRPAAARGRAQDDPFARPVEPAGAAVTPRAWRPDEVVDCDTLSLSGTATWRGRHRGAVATAPEAEDLSGWAWITVTHRGERWYVDIVRAGGLSGRSDKPGGWISLEAREAGPLAD